MNGTQDSQSTSFRDVKQLGLFAAIASLGYVFWVVGAMEMIERLADCGVKAVATLYAKDPVSDGGLGVNLSQSGTLLMVLERMADGETSMPPPGEIGGMITNTGAAPDELMTLYRDDADAFVASIPQGEALHWLVALTGDTPASLTDLLYTSHNIGLVWYVLGVIGILTAIGIWPYGRWILTLKTDDRA